MMMRYLIRNQNGAIIHANDNWNNFLKLHEKLIKERTKIIQKSILYFLKPIRKWLPTKHRI